MQLLEEVTPVLHQRPVLAALPSCLPAANRLSELAAMLSCCQPVPVLPSHPFVTAGDHPLTDC